MRRFPLLLGVCVAALTLACASGTGGATRTTGSRNVLTGEQLAETMSGNAMDAVRRLRPGWLRPRSGRATAVVFMDNTRAGDLDQLSVISIESIAEIRYISPSDATTRWGTGYPAGVIQVIMKR